MFLGFEVEFGRYKPNGTLTPYRPCRSAHPQMGHLVSVHYHCNVTLLANSYRSISCAWVYYLPLVATFPIETRERHSFPVERVPSGQISAALAVHIKSMFEGKSD